MDLIIDIGNTRIKYGFFQNGELMQKRYCAENELIQELSQLNVEVNRIMISSVKSIKQELQDVLKNSTSKVYYLSTALKLPFNNAYHSPETIGADRLALAAGGLKQFPNQAVLVIDMGTCMTFDFIDEKSNYLGGAIAPGLLMRFKALHEFTGKLPMVSAKQPKDLIGSTTEESMRSGVVNGMLKELDGIIDEYKMRYPGVKIILTGGDSSFFDKKLKSSIFADAEILLKGMHFILEHHAIN